MTVEWIGYAALGVSVLSINMTKMLAFRWIHLLAAGLYAAYGILIDAGPIVASGAIFMVIHAFHLFRIYSKA
jgi:hypothetical protein